MKKSGYRTIFHIYLIFLLGLLGAFLASACFFFLLITVRKPDGSLAKSDWPKLMTESFREEILFLDPVLVIKQCQNGKLYCIVNIFTLIRKRT